MWEELFVGAVVLTAGIMLGRRIWRVIAGRRIPSCGSCSTCPHTPRPGHKDKAASRTCPGEPGGEGQSSPTGNAG